MPLDHACMTDQEFSCGFKSHLIGEYAIGLSKSNQSLHGFSTCKDFCLEFAQIKTWEKPPIKGKYLVTLRDQSVYYHGMQSILSSSIDWKLFGPFIDILHVESAVQTLKRGTKGNPIFRIRCWNYTTLVQNTNIITHTTHYVHDEDCKRMRLKKKNIWEGQKAKPVNSEFIF